MSPAAPCGPTLTETIDPGPSCDSPAGRVLEIADTQLHRPTPCPEYTVADLVEHVGALAVEFRYAALEQPTSAVPGSEAAGSDGDGSRLESGRRERIATDLRASAEAWKEPASYDGETHAGPVTLPAREAALVALDEVVVHGWDLSVATGLRFSPDRAAVRTCLDFVAAFDAPANDDGGLLGPPVGVPEGSPPLLRLLGATGRDGG